MTADLSPLTGSASWFASTAEETDVVISSRVRLARNLADFLYRPTQDDDGVEVNDSYAAADIVVAAVRRELMPDVFDAESIDLDVESLPTESQMLLVERRLIEDPFPTRLFVTADESTSIQVACQDHLRLSILLPGVQPKPALAVARLIDKKLEEHLNYAVSLDLGYLNTSILNLGTALRASVMLHLPSLARLGRIEETQAKVRETDFVLDPDEQLTANDGESAVFRLSNKRTIGLEEDAVVDKLADGARALVSYERRAREELVRERADEVADEAHRALGILRHARRLSADETLTLLSSLRQGIVGGLLKDVAVETVTALLFMSRENHVRAVAHQEVEAGDNGEESIQRARASLVRGSLAG